MPQLNRRRFLQTAAAAFAAPYIIPSSCFGANERVTVGCIGFGGQGMLNLGAFHHIGQVVAVCDVDSERIAKAVKFLSEHDRKGDTYHDYRKMLERKDLDVVCVSVPDHWHSLMTIHACQAGKDVYCEKPLSLTIMDGRRMVNAARENNRIVQTGSQQRSDEKFWKACTLVRNGAIGKIEKVLVGIAKANHPGPLGPDSDPPSNLDYDMWLGPAPWRNYNEKRVHYNFRFWWDYSGGQITNWGAHHLDIAQWGLGSDESGPISCHGQATFHPEKVHEVTESCRITYDYADGVKVILGQLQNDIPFGATFIGSEGTISVNRGQLTADPTDILNQNVEDLPIQLNRSTNHRTNFLDCVKTRTLPICDVEIGHRSATVCHLGNIVARLGRGIKWDPVTETIPDDEVANRMIDREYREPWSHDSHFTKSS